MIDVFSEIKRQVHCDRILFVIDRFDKFVIAEFTNGKVSVNLSKANISYATEEEFIQTVLSALVYEMRKIARKSFPEY